MEVLGRHGVLDQDLTEMMASAVRFRNLLVHRYASVDDDRAVGHLAQVEALRRFVAAVIEFADQG
jgi:uncharacterized protein YutE (UPF0331/DUF86 family)